MTKKATRSKPSATTTTPATPPPPSVPVLTRPMGIASGKGTPKAEVRGHEEAVDRIIEIRRELENLEAEEKQLRAPVQDDAKNARNVLERQTGKTIKSVIVHGTGTNQARMTWRNSYRTADVAHEAPLRECLGAHFDALFEIRFKVKVKDTSNEILGLLRSLMGDDKFENVFEVTPEIGAREDLMEKRTILASTLSANQNAALDVILDQLQATPSLSTK